MSQQKTQPSYQQNLVTSNLSELFQAVNNANDELDRRIERLATVSGAIVAFVGGATALTGSNVFEMFSWSSALMIGVFLLSVAIFLHCRAAWSPVEKKFPTLPDAQKLYTSYICKGVDDAYNLHLVALCKCIQANQAINTKKGEDTDWILFLVMLQVGCVAVSLLLKSLGY